MLYLLWEWKTPGNLTLEVGRRDGGCEHGRLWDISCEITNFNKYWIFELFRFSLFRGDFFS